MKSKKRIKTHKIRTFEQLADLATKDNVNMLCGNLYGCVLQFIELRKIAPDLKFTGFDWEDDGKIEIKNPKIKLIVTKQKPA